MLKKLFPKRSNPKSYLAREITLVLVIKIVLITMIWFFLIREHSVKFNDQQVADHLVVKQPRTLPLKQNMEQP